jgi:malate dehydrogenase
MARRKIGIIGAGQVGAATARSLMYRGLADVIISDIIEGMPQGKALDIAQSRPVDRVDSTIKGTNILDEMKDCEIIVLTAGVPRKPGMTREDLLNVNANIVKEVANSIKKFGAEPILVVVTNPLDVMTYLALKLTGFDRRKVFGMAGVLDSIRFSHFVAERLGVSVKDISAMVLGSHGDSMVPMPRYTTVAGVPITDLLPKDDIEQLVKRTRNAGTEIVGLLKTGSAFYAPGDSVAAMVESILNDENRIMPCATYLNGEYGLEDVVIGVPVKLGEGGIKEIIQLKLTEEEKAGLTRSAGIVKENIGILKKLVGL